MKNSITIKLFAGLGNQIFQYIYGQYKVMHCTKVTFLQDTYVDDFSSVFKTNKDVLNKCKYIKSNSKIKNLLLKIFYKYILRNYYTEYFQEKFYALDMEPLLGMVLQFKYEDNYINTKEYKTIKETESVSLHIRGGDYHKEPKYANICTKEYYQNAIKTITEQRPSAQFFVFTNDTEYAKKITEGFENITYVKNEELKKDPGFDLFLMSQCKHNIIANSTFSWWGAFMNQNNEKTVICPSKWTNDKEDVIDNFTIKNWIKV